MQNLNKTFAPGQAGSQKLEPTPAFLGRKELSKISEGKTNKFNKVFPLAVLLLMISVFHSYSQTVTQGSPATTSFIPKWGTLPAIKNSQIFDAGSSGIGINTTSPNSYLNINVPDISGQEQAFRIDVNDAVGSDWFKIYNGTSLDGTFNPTLWGHVSSASNYLGLGMIGSINSDGIGNTNPVMGFFARTWDGSSFGSLTNRPLFAWYNLSTVQMLMNASGNLGLGLSTPAARLDIKSAGTGGTALNIVNSSNTQLFTVLENGNVGIGTNSPSASLDQEYSGSTSNTGILLNNSVSGGTSATSISATSTNTKTGSSLVSIGVSGTANLSVNASSSSAFGISGISGSGGTSNTYYAGCFTGGSGGTNTYYAGYFSGNIGGTGTFSYTSDAKLKTNIVPLTSALDNLLKMQPKVYNFKTQEYPSMHLAEGDQMGLIAQDLEKIYPNLVRNDRHPEVRDKDGNIKYASIDYKGVNYIGLIPVIISGIQEQQATIQKQQATISAQQAQNNQLQNTVNDMQDKYNAILAEIEQLKTMQAQCCSSTGTNNINTGSIVTANSNPSLSQNTPNPFTQNTIIKYFLPENMSNGVINVRTLTGNTVQSFVISTSGSGQVALSAGTLAPGTYQYDLTVNGKIIDSKRMIIIGQ